MSLKILHEDIERRVAEISRDGWPCRKGCDHCCRSLARQPVLTEAEWLLLAPQLDAKALDRIQQFKHSRICPLLADGVCSVYDVRPVACRTYGFYADREGGLHCSLVEERPDVVWGNAEAVEDRLNAFGPRRTLAEWSRL